MRLSKKTFRIKSLRWQLLSVFILILITSLLIIGVYQTLTMKQYLFKSKEILLESRFRNIKGDAIKHINSSDEVTQNAPYFMQSAVDVNIAVAVIDNKGNIIASDNSSKIKQKHDNEKTDKNKESDDEVENKYNIPVPVPDFGASKYIKLLHQKGDLEGNTLIKDENNNLQIVIWRKIGDINNPYGLIQISTSAQPEHDTLNRQLYVYIVASVMVIIISIVLGVTLFKRTLKPLYDMTSTVEDINVGRLNTRLPENNGQLEIDKLSVSFNNMLERIEISFKNEQIIKEKMRHFVSDASHELRTPLTSIHGFVEVLLRGAAKNEKQLDSALNSILTESERLTKLVNDLLTLTRLDQQPAIEMKTENINNIITELLPQLQILLGNRKLELQLKDNIFVHINKDQIKQVIINLVQNAVQHTDENTGIITICSKVEEITSHATFALLKISDNGTGIPKEHLGEIFDRFFRSESHRSRKHGGYGLGLSIVKSIVDAHGGHIKVESEQGLGTTFLVYLKLDILK